MRILSIEFHWEHDDSGLGCGRVFYVDPLTNALHVVELKDTRINTLHGAVRRTLDVHSPATYTANKENND